MDNVKQQYDYFLDMKDKESEDFIAQFNKYYAHKSKQLTEYRSELMALLGYVHSEESQVHYIKTGFNIHSAFITCIGPLTR